MEFKHVSVLLQETVDGLNVKPDGIYVDGTLGGGGHSYEVCTRLGAKGSIIGIDQDEAAIEAASIRLKDFGEKVTIVRSNYCDMKSRLHELGIDKVDGIMLDLGVSSYQLDTADRGFLLSRRCTPLDMRMDQVRDDSQNIVNDYSEMDLYRVIAIAGAQDSQRILPDISSGTRERDLSSLTGELTRGNPPCNPNEISKNRSSGQTDVSGNPY